MKRPTTLPTTSTATMSSLEIAELTGKKHHHVIRDIREMLEALGEVATKFGGNYRASNGKENPCFHLPYDETMTLVAGYDAALRFKIVRRWRELEQAKPALPDFSNPAAAARAWADEVEAKLLALSKVEEMKPRKGPSDDHYQDQHLQLRRPGTAERRNRRKAMVRDCGRLPNDRPQAHV